MPQNISHAVVDGLYGDWIGLLKFLDFNQNSVAQVVSSMEIQINKKVLNQWDKVAMSLAVEIEKNV